MPEAKTTAKPSTLTPYLKGSYAFADLTFMLMVTLTNTYAQIFLTDIALFPTAIAGSILFFGRILDTISTPPIGVLIQKSNLKWGKYRPWLVTGSVLTLVFNILIFVNWNGDSGQVIAKAVTCCLIYAAFCASTNLLYTGFTALNSSLTPDPRERIRLSSLRNQGGAIGKIIAGYLLVPMIHFFGGSNSLTGKGMLLSAVVTSIILVIGYVNLANAAKGKDTPEAINGIQGTVEEKLTTAEVIKFTVTNRPLMCLFGADIMRILVNIMTAAIFPYFFIYIAKDQNAIPMLFGSTSIALLVGATLVRYVVRLMSKRNAYLLGMVVLAISFVVARMFKDNTYMMVGALIVGYVGYSFGNSLTTAMYADIVDYGEVKYGKNARANYFSMYQLSIKVAAIASTGIAGFGLAAIGYVADTEPTQQVISGINFICLALPIGLSVVSIALLLLYNLSDKKMDEVRAELARKRG